jgi:RNA polymerase sigma-70 factor (ECF subfamily)
VICPADIARIFRDEGGRVLATLIRLVGDFDLAEDALQDAFAVALERWSRARCPIIRAPGWSMSGATRRSDRIRPQAAFRGKQRALRA